MLEIQYLNCEIDNGQFTLSFDFPMKIGSVKLCSIERGDMTEFVKKFCLAVSVRDFISVDLGFMIMLNKKERHEIIMSLGIDNTLESLKKTCSKYAISDKNVLGFLYTRSLDFYFNDLVLSLKDDKKVAEIKGDLTLVAELSNIIEICESIFKYIDNQLSRNKLDFKELYYEDISIFEYDDGELLESNNV